MTEMRREFDVAVVGATGAVGEVMLSILEERDFPVGNVYPLASGRSQGKTIVFRGKQVQVGNLEDFDFSRAKIGLFSAGASVSQVHAPRAAAAGCVVVDNTSQFRFDDDIPLVVPEVNPEKIAEYTNRGSPQAHPQGGRHRAHQRLHLPGRVGDGQGGHRGAGEPDQVPAERKSD